MQYGIPTKISKQSSTVPINNSVFFIRENPPYKCLIKQDEYLSGMFQ